jgi:A/G-specific adenine glycosylase
MERAILNNEVILSNEQRRDFAKRLLAWFKHNARDLPWRRTKEPYAVWLSEVMLQQTQVETVKPYFKRFLGKFPTIAAMAAAEEQEVLRLWEGLGYYRRARQLHRAAQVIVSDHGGEFPRDPVAVERLPGIGRYTAGAVLSIAFDLKRPILEANTIRLFSRLMAFDGDTASSSGQKALWALAESLLPERDVGQFNQALMELGSMVCQPREPHCGECPVTLHCRARAAGRERELPRPKPRMKFEDVTECAVVLRRGGKVLVIAGPEKGRWAGLWDFPRFALQAERTEGEIEAKVLESTGMKSASLTHLKTWRHGVTRFRITLDCYEAQHVSGRIRKGQQWVAPADLSHFPLNSTGRKLAQLISQ